MAAWGPQQASPPLDKLGWVSFLEDGEEPQERARPTFSGREKTGQTWLLAPAQRPSDPPLPPRPRHSSCPCPPTLKSPDISRPTPSSEGLPTQPRSAWLSNGGHCPPLLPAPLLPALF